MFSFLDSLKFNISTRDSSTPFLGYIIQNDVIIGALDSKIQDHDSISLATGSLLELETGLGYSSPTLPFKIAENGSIKNIEANLIVSIRIYYFRSVAMAPIQRLENV